MRIRQRSVVLVVGGVAVVAIVTGLFMRPTVYDAEVAVVRRDTLRVTVDEDGVTRLRRHTEIAAPVTGRLAESAVDVGDSVRAGQVVAVMRPAPLDPRTRAEAEATAAAARSMRSEADSRVAQAQVALEEARRAERRAEQLAAKNVIAQRDRELAADAVQLRARDLAAAEARARAAAADERRARLALVAADPAAAGDARVEIRSSIAGRVLRRFVEHDRVVPAGTPIVEVGDPASMDIVVDVLSREATDVHAGDAMLVTFSGRPALRGRVTRVEPAAFTRVSPLGVEEQRVNVIGELADRAPLAGDRFEVDVSIVTWEGANVLQLPTSALVPVNSGWGAFVQRDGRAHLVELGIGHRGARAAEVSSGVAAGDSVITHPDDRLRDGDRVRVARR